MLWKEIAELEDCDLCPVKEAELCSGGCNCYGGVPVEPPCCMFDDDTDIEQWIADRYDAIKRYEAWQDAQAKKRKSQTRKSKKIRRNKAGNAVVLSK